MHSFGIASNPPQHDGLDLFDFQTLCRSAVLTGGMDVEHRSHHVVCSHDIGCAHEL